MPFNRELDFEYGRVQRLSPLVRRVIAHNPGPYTFHGTGTYLVGNGDVAVIDPGPAQPAHVAAILEATDGERISHLLVTHTHRDHSPACAALQAATGAPTLGFGPHPRHEGWRQVEEGADYAFEPDLPLRDGERVLVREAGWTLGAIHTPGHTSNHLCFALAEEQALFCGDHVMGWSTSVIAPPDGHMGDYLASLRRLRGRGERIYYPTHGAPIDDPQSLLAAYLAHRERREREVLACLAGGPQVIPEMVHSMYPGLDRRLLPAAGCSVLAHLLLLIEQRRVRTDGDASLETVFELIADRSAPGPDGESFA